MSGQKWSLSEILKTHNKSELHRALNDSVALLYALLKEYKNLADVLEALKIPMDRSTAEAEAEAEADDECEDENVDENMSMASSAFILDSHLENESIADEEVLYSQSQLSEDQSNVLDSQPVLSEDGISPIDLLTSVDLDSEYPNDDSVVDHNHQSTGSIVLHMDLS